MLKIRCTSVAFLAASTLASQAFVVWQVGIDDNGWPIGDGGGPNTTFVQESGINSLPGDPNSPEVNAQADDDYYFAGLYTTQVNGGPAYVPVGSVLNNEEAAERAFSGTDNNLRYHFNLPAGFDPTNLLSVSFDANTLHSQGGTEHYGVEVYINSVLVMAEVDVNPGTLDFDFTSPPVTLASVNAQVGPGFDNIVELRGINYNASGGGNWMGVDYVQLDANPVPEPSLWALLGLASASCLLLRRRP